MSYNDRADEPKGYDPNHKLDVKSRILNHILLLYIYVLQHKQHI